MSSEDVGRRCTDGAYEWNAGIIEGRPLMIRHCAPDMTSHLYPAGDINESILLYRGCFTILLNGKRERTCDGDVRLSWLPTPRIEVRGEYHSGPEDFEALLSSTDDTQIWYPRTQIRLPDSESVPTPPTEEAPTWSRERHTAFIGPAEIYPPEIGDGTTLTRVTGLLVNGWDGYGSAIADPTDRRQTWFGRSSSRGGDWLVNMDALNPGSDQQGKLRGNGGYGVTHTVSISRADSSSFTADDLKGALQAMRCALSLILGRRADVVLPVGWNDGEPVWAWWTAGVVDSFRERGSWLDASIAADQSSEVVGRILDNWPDGLHSDTLRYATSYYVQALRLGAELGVAAAVSGLLLIGASWLVEDEQIYSQSAWGRLNPQAEKQIRSLLQFSACRINTAVPEAFVNLADVTHQLNATRKSDEDLKDGLSSIIKMRNDVVHPTRHKRSKCSAYQWTEAHSLTVHFLELALLAYVGYRGRFHPRTAANRWLGYVVDVPWTGC
jgi:hypothetical protein